MIAACAPDVPIFARTTQEGCWCGLRSGSMEIDEPAVAGVLHARCIFVRSVPWATFREIRTRPLGELYRSIREQGEEVHVLVGMKPQEEVLDVAVLLHVEGEWLQLFAVDGVRLSNSSGT